VAKEKKEAPGSKVSRILTITIEPHTPDEYAVTFKDTTTESKSGRREGHFSKFSKMTQGGGLADLVGLQFREFAKSLDDYQEGELFAEDKSAKPRLDPKA